MIEKVTVPEGESGNWRIEKKTMEPNPMFAARLAVQGRSYRPGTYTMLYRGNTLVMSDTPDEMRDHYPAVYHAKGHCLIVGLGIGMVLNAVAQNDSVEHITVVEQSEDVLILVKDHYDKMYPGKITFINADIFEWKPEKDSFFDMAWYDIWDDMFEDNLEEMKKLHRKFGRKTGWQGSWGRDYIESMIRRNNRYAYV